MSPTVDPALDASGVRSWIHGSLRALAEVRAELDRHNVFPVPDADTGSNLYATLEGAARRVDAIDASRHTTGDLLAALADGALAGARGNSGTILGAYLRGFADGGGGPGPWGAGELVAALGAAADAAARSVARPAPGSILTAAADAALAAWEENEVAGAGPAAVVTAAGAAARRAAVRSVEDSPHLARFGVLDAGALGLVAVLDALAATVAGTVPPPLPSVAGRGATPAPGAFEAPDGQFEVMVAAPLDEIAADGLRDALAGLGESVVVTGTDGGAGLVHVHADDPSAVVRAVGEAVGEGTALEVDVHALVTEGLPLDRTTIAFTTSPALVADLARTGALVLLRPVAPIREGAPLPDADLVLPAWPLDPRARADLAARCGPGAEILDTACDAQVLVAVSAALTARDPATPIGPMRRAVAAARVLRVDGTGLPPCAGAAVVTALVDDDVDPDGVEAWADALSRDGTDVVVLATGKPGTGIDIAVEDPS